MKNCKACNLIKPIGNFYTHKSMSDGHVNECKECSRLRLKADYYRNKENPNWVKKESARSKVRGRNRTVKNGGKLPPTKRLPVLHQAEHKNYYAQYPEKYDAYKATDKVYLKSSEFEFHHWSYCQESQIDVIKLTVKDHKKVHTHIYYDQEHMLYRTFNHELLSTREEHISFIRSIGCCPVEITTSDRKSLKYQRYLTYNGVTKRKIEWAKDLGLKMQTFCNRVDKWSLDRVMSNPPVSKK